MRHAARVQCTHEGRPGLPHVMPAQGLPAYAASGSSPSCLPSPPSGRRPFPMDRHYLTPLFEPRSLVVFAGDPQAAPPTPMARQLREALAASVVAGYGGQLTWLDVGMSGTLAEALPTRPRRPKCRCVSRWCRYRCIAAISVCGTRRPTGHFTTQRGSHLPQMKWFSSMRTAI